MFNLKRWQVDVSTETLNFGTYLSLSLSRRSFSRQALVPGGALDSGRDLSKGKAIVTLCLCHVLQVSSTGPRVCDDTCISDVDSLHFPRSLLFLTNYGGMLKSGL
jgi:hypothetical protein